YAVFVTVDPERDTSAHLAEYVPLFHSRLIGLTGSAGAIGSAAEAYRVYFRKEPGGDRDGYSVDQSAFIYLVDRDGRYLGFVPPGTP
ncbi:SCO family protein, partial [Klebsiella pneumoniae]|uniref:SCO family protein n=1 Tax=Klebsiella pneumoniae TaxID=573 RepID=UPI0034646C6F